MELDNFFGEAWYLCSWTAEGVHMDYGAINPLPDPEDPDYEGALQAEISTVLQLMNSNARPAGSADEAGAGN